MSNPSIVVLGLFLLAIPAVNAQVVVDTVPIRPDQPLLTSATKVDGILVSPTPSAHSKVTVVDVVQTTPLSQFQSNGAVTDVPVSLQAQATSPSAICPAALPGTLDRVINRTPGIRWSVQVQTQGAIGNRATLYAWNPRTQLAPASNNKVFTTAAALQGLGSQFRFRTVVTGNAAGSNPATLRIVGQGDPSLKTSHMALLAQQLQQRGIRQVSLLIGDDTYFRGSAINPNWDADDALAGYGAPVNSLMINQNGIGVTLYPQRVGQPLRVQWDDPSDAQDYRLSNRTITVSSGSSESIDMYRDRNSRLVNIEGQLRAGSAPELAAAAINNPGNYLIQKFRNALTAVRITVNQSTLLRSIAAPPGEIELAAVESPPLATLLIETNRESNNTYAEALLKTIGKAQNPNNTNATQAGVAAVKAILSGLGVDASQYSMIDGSGLANNNRSSAEALVQTLQAMTTIPDAAVYRNSLPVAAVNGTLSSRFRNTAAQGRVQAKTGTISGVVSLSGYAAPPNYVPLTFGVIANSSSASATTMRSAIDEMVITLMRLRRC